MRNGLPQEMHASVSISALTFETIPCVSVLPVHSELARLSKACQSIILLSELDERVSRGVNSGAAGPSSSGLQSKELQQASKTNQENLSQAVMATHPKNAAAAWTVSQHKQQQQVSEIFSV